MSIAVVGAPTTQYFGGTQSVVVTKPTGVVQGDLMLVRLLSYNPTNGDHTINAVPSGWTLFADPATVGSGAGSGKSRIYYKYAEASEPASWTWTMAVDYAHFYADCIALSGATLDTAVAATGWQATSSGLTVTIPTITTLVADSWHLGWAWISENPVGTTWTPPAGYTEQVDHQLATGHRDELISKAIAAAGATADQITTVTATDGARREGISVVVKPSNNAPNAPTLTSPVGGAAMDRTQVIPLQGGFSDSDVGDQLSQTEVEYRLVAGGTTSMGTAAASGQTFTRNIAADTLAAGDYEWRAKTWDNAGEPGPWSGWAAFTAASPPAAPVITMPAVDGDDINTNPYLVEWTAAAQDAYQVRTVDDDAGVADPTEVYTDSGTVEQPATRAHAVAVPVNDRTEHVQIRVRSISLWSLWASRRGDVTYIPPGSPVVVVTTHASGAAFVVTIDNPAGGTAVAHNELERSERASDTDPWSDAIVLDGATAVAVDGSFTDWAVASGHQYRYRTVAVGTNGTRTTGAWSDLAGEAPGDVIDGGAPDTIYGDGLDGGSP